MTFTFDQFMMCERVAYGMTVLCLFNWFVVYGVCMETYIKLYRAVKR